MIILEGQSSRGHRAGEKLIKRSVPAARSKRGDLERDRATGGKNVIAMIRDVRSI